MFGTPALLVHVIANQYANFYKEYPDKYSSFLMNRQPGEHLS